MEKSLTCPCCCYTLALLLSLRCFLIFPVLCVLQLYLWTYTPNSRNPHYLKSQRKINVLNGILPSLFYSPFSSLHCTVQRFYRIPYIFGKATIATNGCPTIEDANHTTKKKLKKKKRPRQLEATLQRDDWAQDQHFEEEASTVTSLL